MSNPTLESTIHEILDMKRMREELDATMLVEFLDPRGRVVTLMKRTF